MPVSTKPRNRLSPVIGPSAMTIVDSANVLPSSTRATTSSPERSAPGVRGVSCAGLNERTGHRRPLADRIASAQSRRCHEIPYSTRRSNRSLQARSPCSASYDRSGISALTESGARESVALAGQPVSRCHDGARRLRGFARSAASQRCHFLVEFLDVHQAQRNQRPDQLHLGIDLQLGVLLSVDDVDRPNV